MDTGGGGTAIGKPAAGLALAVDVLLLVAAGGLKGFWYPGYLVFLVFFGAGMVPSLSGAGVGVITRKLL